MSTKIEEIIEQVEGLTVGEVVKLVKHCEERWGVSASAAPVASGSVNQDLEEEDTEKEVILTEIGEKIKVIKSLREINSDLSLMDAKKAVESITETTPYSLGKFEKTKAEELIKKFEEIGSKPKIK